MNNAISFGLELLSTPLAAEQRETLLDDNRRFLNVSRNHFQTAWVEDHFQYEADDQLEGWTYLTYLMPSFPELQFGTLVLGQSYRNPALLAKMAATLQRLSGGRFVLGIGAGWKADEYRAYGWEFPTAAQRVAELSECARILKAMWKDTPASIHGKHYSIRDAYCEPKPTPPVPLMIGGKGERGTLRVVARYADWWNCSLLSPDGFRQNSMYCEIIAPKLGGITMRSRKPFLVLSVLRATAARRNAPSAFTIRLVHPTRSRGNWSSLSR